MRTLTITASALTLLLVGALTGCNKDKPAPAEPPAPAKVEAPKKADPAAEKAAAEAQAEAEPKVEEPKDDGIPEVVATVDGVALNGDIFRDALARYMRPGLDVPQDRLHRLRSTILDRMIDDALVNAAVEKAGIEVDRQKVEDDFKEYKARFKSEKQYASYLESSRMTEERIKRQIVERLGVEALLEKQGSLTVKPKEAKAFYDEHPDLYKEREMVSAAHILIRLARDADAEAETAAKEKLQKAQTDLAAGKSFDEVARTYSDGPSAPRGGDLGKFGRGQMVEAFENVAFSLAPGKVSQPVRTPFGLHLIKVKEKTKARTKPFAEVRPQLLDSLRRKRFAEHKRKLLKGLRETAKVERHLAR